MQESNRKENDMGAEETIDILEDIITTFSDEEDEDWRRALRYAIGCIKEVHNL